MQPFYTLNQNTISLIAEFLPIKDILKLKILCKFSYKNLSLDQHHILRKMNWDFICSKPHSENFIEKYTAYINWDVICVFQKLSIGFMKKHWEELYIDRLCRYQLLNEELMEKIIDINNPLHLSHLIEYQKLSQKLLFGILEKIKSLTNSLNNIGTVTIFNRFVISMIKNQIIPFSVVEKEFGTNFILLALKKQNYKFSEIENDSRVEILKDPTFVNVIAGKNNFFDTNEELMKYMETALPLIDWSRTKIIPRVLELKKSIVELYDVKIDDLMNRILKIRKMIDEESSFTIEHSVRKLGEMLSEIIRRRSQFKINAKLQEKIDFEIIDEHKAYINWGSLFELPSVDENIIQKYIHYTNYVDILIKKEFSKEFYDKNAKIIMDAMMSLLDGKKIVKIVKNLLKVGIDYKKLPRQYFSISELIKENIITYEELGESLEDYSANEIIGLISSSYVPQWLCIKIALYLEKHNRDYENMFVTQHFTEETLLQMKNSKLNMEKYKDVIGVYQRLSEKFIDENIEMINISICMAANKISAKLIEKHWDKIEWHNFVVCPDFVDKIEKTYPEIYPRFKKSLEDYINQAKDNEILDEDEDDIEAIL